MIIGIEALGDRKHPHRLHIYRNGKNSFNALNFRTAASLHIFGRLAAASGCGCCALRLVNPITVEIAPSRYRWT